MVQIKKPGLKPAVITLKAVAQHLGLTPGTVSAVLNDSPSARSIPQETKNRIHAAAKELNYRPNFFARTLRNKRTYTIGVIAEEIGDSYSSPIISGIEHFLRQRDYFFLTVVHRHDPGLLSRYSQLLSERGVEGIITVDTTVQEAPMLPTVAVAGHRKLKGVSNIVLDHEQAAVLALNHFKDLGHERIAFMRGNPVSADSKDRWDAICRVAARIGMRMDPDLIVQLESDDPSAGQSPLNVAKATTPHRCWVIPSPNNCWRATSPSRRCLPTTIFRPSAQFEPFRNTDCGFRRMCR